MGQHKRRFLAEQDARRRATVLRELAEGNIDVFCWCNRCGHNSIIPTSRLMAELGPDFTVPEVGSRLRCTGCSSKDVAARPNWPSVGPVARHD